MESVAGFQKSLMPGAGGGAAAAAGEAGIYHIVVNGQKLYLLVVED